MDTLLDTFIQGEDFIKDIAIKVNGVALDFDDINTATVVVSDRKANVETYTKSGGTVVEGANSNDLSFQITAAQSSAFVPGILSVRVTINFDNARFTGGDTTQKFDLEIAELLA